MSNAVKYIENVSIVDEDDIEIVTVNEAITACELTEQSTLNHILEEFNTMHIQDVILLNLKTRLEKLNLKLKNIKIK